MNGSFAAEGFAALQSLRIADGHEWPKVILEGDALNVIQALNHSSTAVDWRG